MKLQLVANYEKNMQRGALWGLKKLPKKLKRRFLNSVSAEKCKRGDPLGFFDIHCVAKCRNKRRGDLLVQSKKFQKKSHSAEKSGAMGGSLVWFWGSGRLFCFFLFRFGRASEVRVFWTSIFQFVEQMNKKVDLTRLKKLPTVRVGHIFY